MKTTYQNLKTTLMFTVAALIPRLAKQEVGLTVRMPSKSGKKDRYGGVGDVGYIREPVRLASQVTGSYAVEYADGKFRDIMGAPSKGLSVSRWTFAMYMPANCARMFYRVKRRQTRHLSTMNESDANRAGFDSVAAYMKAWDELNAKRGYPAADDPLVNFVYFDVIEVRK